MSWKQASNPSHQFMITVSNMKSCAGEASKGGGREEAKAGHGVEEDKFWLDSQRMSGVLWILGITLETQEPHQEQKLSTFHANMNRGVFSENLPVVQEAEGSKSANPRKSCYIENCHRLKDAFHTDVCIRCGLHSGVGLRWRGHDQNADSDVARKHTQTRTETQSITLNRRNWNPKKTMKRRRRRRRLRFLYLAGVPLLCSGCSCPLPLEELDVLSWTL